MLKTGEWLSISILGLVILFIFVSFSFFNFLIGPNSTGPRTTVEPSSAFIQIIFISAAPAIARPSKGAGRAIAQPRPRRTRRWSNSRWKGRCSCRSPGAGPFPDRDDWQSCCQGEAGPAGRPCWSCRTTNRTS